jgi:hypothetical protein
MKLLDRLPSAIVPAQDLQQPTTALGAWYATVLFWRPHVVLFVNEPTRLPLIVPFAPSGTVVARMTQTAGEVFATLGLPETFVSREITEMSMLQLTKTASRSVLGTMNDFAYLADAHREPDGPTDLIELSLRLAETPCGPLYSSHISPDREILAYAADYRS